MSAAATYYLQVRGILWPVLMGRVDKTKALREQVFAIAANENKAAKKLLRLPTGGAPAALVRHAEAWAKHLQGYEEIIRSADALDLFEPDDEEGSESHRDSEPGLIRTAVGGFLAVFLHDALGLSSRSGSSTPAERASASAFSAHQKRAQKYSDERTRLEALLERAGADHVPDLQARDSIRLLRWAEKEELHPKQAIMGPTDAEVEEQLSLLPGGDQLSVVELFPRSDEYLSVFGAVDEGFTFRYDDKTTGCTMESAEDGLPLAETLKLVRNVLAAPDEWESLVKWCEQP